MKKSHTYSTLRRALILMLLFCVSMGYYEELLKNSFNDTIDLVESCDGESEKEKEEKEKEGKEKEEKEIDELYSTTIGNLDFVHSKKDLERYISGKSLANYYLDKFTPPPEKA